MTQLYFHKKKTLTVASMVIALLCMFSFELTQAQDLAFVRVNKYWGTVDPRGINTGTSYSANDLQLFADQGAFGLRLQGDESHYGANVTLACSDWKDPNTGNVIPKAIFPAKNQYQPNGLEVLEPMTNYVRYETPVDSVYYQDKTRQLPSPDFGTPIAQVSPENCIGTSDQTVTTQSQYYNGVIVTRRVLAWGQQLHDNYVIVDLTFDNPADNDTLHNFYIFLQEGNYYFVTADGNNPGIAAVDRFYNGNPRRWYHYYGSRTTDSLRISYQYAADDPEKPGSNMGQPLTQQRGRLFSKDFFFAATLHASKEPYKPAGNAFPSVDANDIDDMNQPSVTTYANIQQSLNLALFSSGTLVDNGTYYDFISGKTLESEDLTGADVRPGHHRNNLDELGKEAPGGETGCSPMVNSFESMVYCYGRYEFLPGTQIRIVKASGVAGISRELAVEVGRKWMNNILTDPTSLPNAETGYFPGNFVFPAGSSEMDRIKDRWISVGIKEMHETVSRAKSNFLSGYNAPVTPPPPPKTVVKPSVYGIDISWEASPAETWSGFVEYRVSKKVSSYDSLYYKVVYQGTDHSFIDGNVRPSPKYYYKIQAGVEANGDTLWSSPFWRYNSEGTSSNQAPSTEGLERIVMVPNPFNYRDPMLANYNFESPRNLTLTFFNLPADVTISVYTEYGDLVRKVQGSGTGDYKMKMVNEKGQAIASGIYVVVFQTPGGGFSYQKLVVAR